MAQTANVGLGWYLDQIRSTPLLTAEEEKQLSRRIRHHGDFIARDQMVRANLRLVVKIAKEYSNPGMTLGDLVAEGNLGLVRAVEEFDPDAGVRFSTYGAWWIKQSIKRAMINAGQTIHIPAYLVRLITRWRKVSRELENELGRPATTPEMAKKLKISAKKAEIVHQGLLAVGTSSQAITCETQLLDDVASDNETISPDQHMLDESDKPMIQSLLNHLPKRQQRILELRFALDGYAGPARTYKQIGQIIGLTRERVRQLEKKALESLKSIANDLL